jgi:serine/threonine protein kinase
LAPETLDAKRHDGHSFEVDIWALGIITFTLLVGRQPFYSKDSNTTETYTKIRAGQYTF